ncbi:MAG: MBL fold metallo-hydrolase [Clostridiaceae bacterium]|nr:MBL fold metallo-hydrolase [Clostridiaceae bacterium]
MFKFCSLYSGSSGNCSFVQTDTTKILIDVGESTKKIVEALQLISIEPSSIDAILVTHEHSDHVKGLGLFSKKFNIPIYANKETWDAMPKQKEKVLEENIKYFSFENFEIGNIKVTPFSIPHDAANPCGFNLYSDNKKMSIATDIGHMDKDIIDHLTNSSFLLLEANYEPEILKCSSYPYMLKERIKGPNGHLSNSDAGKTISYLSSYGLKNVMLGHLSKENNFPELAYKTVVEELIENNISENLLTLTVANRYNVSPMIDVS